jgi:hypothetical protein
VGTIWEWGHVTLAGAFWGGWMLIWYRRRRTGRAKTERSLLIADVLTWMFAGLWFGIMSAFNGRAFHPPIVFVMIGAIAGGLFFGRRSAHEQLKIMRGGDARLDASHQ